MPNLQVDKRRMQKYIKDLQGKPYLQVGGRVFLAHDARQLLGVHFEHEYIPPVYEETPIEVVVTTTELITVDEATGESKKTVQTKKTPEYKSTQVSPGFYRVTAYATILNRHIIEDAEDFWALPLELQQNTFEGTAQSKTTGGRSAEGTNPLEVAETSALGRALGFAGFGDLESIASYEEVQTAISRRDPVQGNGVATGPSKAALLLANLKQQNGGKLTKAQADKLANAKYGVDQISDLTTVQVEEWFKELTQEDVAF